MIKFAVFSPENTLVEKIKKLNLSSVHTCENDIRLSDGETAVEYLDETDVEIAIISEDLDNKEGLIEKAIKECSDVVIVGNEKYKGVETIKEDKIEEYFGLVPADITVADIPSTGITEKQKEKGEEKIRDIEVMSLENELFGTKTEEKKEKLGETILDDFLYLAAKMEVSPIIDEALPQITAKDRPTKPVPEVGVSIRKKASPFYIHNYAFNTCKIISVYGAKGGTGVSTVAFSIASQLAIGDEKDYPATLLIDLSMRYGSLGKILIEADEPNLFTYIKSGDEESLTSNVLFDEETHLALLTGGTLEQYLQLDETAVKWVLKNAGDYFQFIIVDCGYNLFSPPVKCSLTSADVIIIVVEPASVALADTRKALSDIREMKRKIGEKAEMFLVINKVGVGGIASDEVVDYLNIPLLGEIPFDYNITRITNSKTLIPVCGDKKIMSNFHSITETLLNILREMEK